jgi:hypothetical protein
MRYRYTVIRMDKNTGEFNVHEGWKLVHVVGEANFDLLYVVLEREDWA